jgi:hypothetical protein
VFFARYFAARFKLTIARFHYDMEKEEIFRPKWMQEVSPITGIAVWRNKEQLLCVGL